MLGEAIYFSVIMERSSQIPSESDMVVVYSGAGGRAAAGLNWVDKLGSKYLLYSGWDLTELDQELTRLGPPKAARVLKEEKARTTDQNAYYCAPFIRSTGVKTIALVLPWYHLPRAYFLTWFFLRGSGIQILPLAAKGVPRLWWCQPPVWLEMVKFWGSLGRMALGISR